MQPPSSYIKDIGIEINPEFLLANTPMTISPGDASHQSFIGREHQREKFLKFLGDAKKGIFLVTGERGIGKTSFVNHVLSSYKSKLYNENPGAIEEAVPEETETTVENNANQQKEAEDKNPHIIPISLTLSQSHPKEIDILWLMVNSVYDRYTGYLKAKEDKREKNEIAINALLMNDNRLASLLALGLAVCWALWPVIESWSLGYTKYLAAVFSNFSSWLFCSIMLIPLMISFYKYVRLSKEKRENRKDQETPQAAEALKKKGTAQIEVEAHERMVSCFLRRLFGRSCGPHLAISTKLAA